MLNTYGITMIGLEEASEATVDWPSHSGYVSIIRYDSQDGKVWVSEAPEEQFAGKYDIFRTVRHVSAQHIADEIAEHVRLVSMTPQARYDEANTTRVSLKLNTKTDADILARLAAQPAETGGKQGYIKRLVRADIEKEGKK